MMRLQNVKQQKRVGLGQQAFVLVKFRTMLPDTVSVEKMANECQTSQES